MNEKKSEKNIVFYTPGKPGASLTIRVGDVVDMELVNSTKEKLERQTKRRIRCVEDRRAMPRYVNMTPI